MNADLEKNIRHGHRLGWSFTPLNGKVPITKGWQEAPRETLEDALAWAVKGNAGLRTGSTSGVVVIDLDEYKDEYDPQAVAALSLPATVTARTGRGGRQLYYAYGGQVHVGNSAGKLAPAVDTKADGGQVVFPGSVHPETHKRYEWVSGLEPWAVELAELPAHIVERLTTPNTTPKNAPVASRAKIPPNGDRYATTALEREVAAVCGANNGTRNETLNKASFSLGTLVGGGFLVREQVEQALLDAAQTAGLPQAEADATIRSGIDAGVEHPRQVEDRPAITSRQQIPTLQPGRFRLDLYGNADRFIHLHGKDVLWCEERGQWLVWDGRVWNPDAIRQAPHLAEITIRAMLKEAAEAKDDKTLNWAVRCNKSAQARKEMLDVVKHRAPVRPDQFDRNPWLLGVENGAVDLKAGRLVPHGRNLMITALCPTVYDVNARCPRWEQFMVEIMDGNEAMVGALQRMAGYFLTGDISVQILPIFYGPGGNGKNVFLDTVTGLMGPYATEAPDGLITARRNDEHPTEIADLCGKRLVVASETEEGRKMRIGLVKKLTGNKNLKGRFMRQDYFEFERTHKTVLVTNNMPVITEMSNAIWRRLRLIPFTVTIPENKQDKQLTEKLVAEWPGILAWAVRGCRDWQQRECDLALPEAVQLATAEYRNDSDHVGDFISERCSIWPANQRMKTAKERIYSAYTDWCRSVSEDMLGRKIFNQRMRTHELEDKPVRIDGKMTKCWLNITLQGPNDA